MKKKRKFNVTGTCVPSRHYMVDIANKLDQIKLLIDEAEYFTINRGRQYGKTTTLTCLEECLANEYEVISISFEGLGDESFADAEIFCQTLLKEMKTALRFSGASPEAQENWTNPTLKSFDSLSDHITNICENKAIVLMIDEVDQTSNNRVFLNFLGMLRSKFLARNKKRDFTFHSVILAGVYDIKNIRLKMMQEGVHQPTTTTEKMYNSPWNIAVNFKVDMSFSPTEIATMLTDYEQDHQTGMNITNVAETIYYYTNGYPVLVSKLCQYMDNEVANFSEAGVVDATRLLVREADNSLFRSISQNLETNRDVYQLMYDVLILGQRRSFSTDNPAVDLAYRYAYIRDDNAKIKISNRIFEIRMTDYFTSKDETKIGESYTENFILEVTRDGKFNMQLCLERFVIHWQELYSDKSDKFLEKECRMLFLMYLKPLLNGVGFYHIESALTDDRRMDLVVIYGKERFVLELKTWKGKLYNEQGVDQLLGYLNKLDEKCGYLLTFDFRKNPEILKPRWLTHDDKQIFEVRTTTTNLLPND